MPRKPKPPLSTLPTLPVGLIALFDRDPKTEHEINATVMALKADRTRPVRRDEPSSGLPAWDGQTASGSKQRNGTGAKTVYTGDDPLRLDIPRDRESSFEPILIQKHERRFTGFDDKIIAMVARGMTVREIREFLLEQYGTHVSPEFVSSVTDEVMAEVTAW